MARKIWYPKVEVKTAAVEDDSVQGRVIIDIPLDPGSPMTATISGEVSHKHIMRCQATITKAFRDYMSTLRKDNLKEINDDE